MFTGIIEKVGPIASLEQTDNQISLWIDTGFNDLELGESIALNGICLTVAQIEGSRALFYLSPETLRATGAGEWKADAWVNLERAMKPTGRLSGHWVQGHVDCRARLVSAVEEGESWKISIKIPKPWDRYIVQKGSITVDGVSLTVNTLESDDAAGSQDASGDATISIQLIPHTWQNTHFSHIMIPSSVNIEVDILAKYVERLVSYPKP